MEGSRRRAPFYFGRGFCQLERGQSLLMSEYKMARLGEVCSFYGGVPIERTLLSEDSTDGMPVILQSDPEEGKASLYYTGEYDPDQIVHPGEYLVSLSDSLAITPWRGQEALLSHHFCRIVPDPQKLNPQYMAYALGYIFFRLNNDEDADFFEEEILVEDLKETFIPLPDLEKQAKIVEVLDNAVALVGLHFEQLDRASLLLESRFVELFGRLDENENGWEVKPLGSLVERLKSRSLLAKDMHEGEYPYYDSTGVVEYIDKYLFDEDLLLVAKVGSVLTSENAQVARAVHGKLWASDLVHVLRVLPGAGVLPEYLEVVINNLDLSSSLRGGVVPKLPKAALNELPIPVPPLELQLEYKNFLAMLSEQSEKIAQRIEETTHICQSLNRYYFDCAISYE